MQDFQYELLLLFDSPKSTVLATVKYNYINEYKLVLRKTIYIQYLCTVETYR